MPRGGKRPGAGRPPLPEGERRDQTHRIPIYPSASERAELDAWAEREGQPLARLVLDRALRAARRS